MKRAWLARFCLFLPLATFGLPACGEPAAPRQSNQPDRTRREERARLAQAIAKVAQTRLVQWRESGLGQTAAVDALEALRETPGGAVELFFARASLSEPKNSLVDREPSNGRSRALAEAIVATLLREPRDLRRRLKLAEVSDVVGHLAAIEQSFNLDASKPSGEHSSRVAARSDAADTAAGAWPASSARLRMLLGEIARSDAEPDDCLAGLAARCQPWLDPPAAERLREAVEQAGQLIAFDRQAGRGRADGLQARQAKLVATLDADGLNEMTSGRLIDEQTAIAHELTQRAGLLGRTTDMRRQLTAARAAADSAAERLFELDRLAALSAAGSVADSLRRLVELMNHASESQLAQVTSEPASRSEAWTAWRHRLARLTEPLDRSQVKPADGAMARDGLAELERLADEQRLPPWADAELIRSTIALRAALLSNEAPTEAARAAPESQVRQAIERVAAALDAEVQWIAAANSRGNLAATKRDSRPSLRFTADADLSTAPWFRKLPAENRRAIVSGRHAPPPRGFAERLKRLQRP